MKKVKAENPNTNVLTEFQCPRCKHFGPFYIRISQLVLVYDEGVEDVQGDNEWTDQSFCSCVECGHEGTVKQFTTATK